MTAETFPIKIYFKVNNILNAGSENTLSPIVTISVNDKIMLENYNLDNNRYDKLVQDTNTVLPEWMDVNAHEDRLRESTRTLAVDDIAVASF